MNLNVDIKMGLGLTRINSNVLEDPQTLGKVKRELAELWSQIPDNWDAQRRLEYIKMAIRTVISENVGRNRKEKINDITDLELTLNEMCNLKSQACALGDLGELSWDSVRVQLIEQAMP